MKRAAALLLAACATLAGAQTPPAYPKDADLIEFRVSAGSDFRFFVDAKSLSVAAGGEVRYTLVARSPSGANNVSYEGMRCTAGEYRVYARGQPDGTWAERPSEWRPIEPKTMQRWHQALRREYFCPQNIPIADAAEGIDALRRGGHPNRKHSD